MSFDQSPGVTGFQSVAALENYISQPTPEVIEALRQLDGDLMVLGVGGKMGPTLAMQAKRAVKAGNLNKRVIGVSRFSDLVTVEKLQRAGVQTMVCDLMDEKALQTLPEVPNIIYMVGMKFGTTGQEARSWAMNTYLVGRVVEKFRQSRLVLFSSGNVYPFTPVIQGGCTEQTPPEPVGEYAQSVLGRERVFEYFACQYNVPGVLLRLNYAVEMRYGVLLDIARDVWAERPVDVSMGHVNVIWQGDANAYAIRALTLAQTPPRILNVTGPETIAVRQVALQFGQRFGKKPLLVGSEQSKALLSNARLAHRLFGYPKVPLEVVIDWVAAWVQSGGFTLDKPTRFQVRDGKF